MKRFRTLYWLLGCLAVSCLALLGFLWGSTPAGKKDWLSVSTPIFGARTKADGVGSTVSFTVTNVGPRTLDFGIRWYECRASSDHRVLATSFRPNSPKDRGYLYGISGDGSLMPLSPGRTCVVTRDLSSDTSANEVRLFCSEISWVGREPKLSGQKVDDYMTWALNIFDVTWTRRWPIKALTMGSVFTSNVEIADYFRVVYDIDVNKDHVSVPSATNYVEIAADMALESFRRHWTTGPHGRAEPDGAASRSQPIRSETNRMSAAAGSGR